MVVRINITWILKDGEEIETECDVGKTLLQIAHKNDIPMEGMLHTILL